MLAALVWLSAVTAMRAQEGGRSLGTIEGVVVDHKPGDPIIEAGIEVIGQNTKIKTDLDGKYSIKLPPGSYELRIFAPLYQGTRLQNVVVTENKVTHADANLKPEGEAAVQTVEVVAEAKKSAETTQILQRQKAAGVSDNISAQQIAKSPDTKASEIIRRVPAVTVQDNKYMFVRGLGPRYSSALLNGSRLPSTDPNKRVIPLDLFPAEFIDALTLVKTYTPDLPGDFSGGLLDVQLREYPAQFTYTIGTSTSVNTATTFQSFETYHSSCPVDDYFGFGANCRDLPGVFGSRLPSHLSTPQQQQLVGSLPVNWNINKMTAPPNFSITGAVGDSWGPFGISMAPIYKTEYRTRSDEVYNSFESGRAGKPQSAQIFTYDQSDFETQLGAVLTTGYQLSPNHKFFGNALVNRHSDDQVLDGKGTTFASPDFPTLPTSQLYTADQLGLGQVGGRDHWNALDAEWRASWAPSSEDQPDGKFLEYQQTNPTEPPHLTDFSPSTTRTYANLSEFLQDYNADLTAPFKTQLPLTNVWSGLPAKFKTGAALAHRHRTFEYRIFRTHINTGNQLPDLTLPPDQILIPPNYGQSNEGFPLTFQEETTPADSFNATQDIYAGYTMLDTPLIADRLRFVGGVRLEYSYIATNGTSPVGNQPADARLNNLDPLPGVNFIYTPRHDMNVRYSVSQTVSRPEFRELTPTQFIVSIGQRTFQGNSNLVESHIVSNDLRWEWFLTPLELVSVSFFYKDLDKPIEIVALSSTSQNIDTPVNAQSGTLWGFEWELRKNFGFLTDYAARLSWLRPIAGELNNVQFHSNISAIESNVTLGTIKLPVGAPCTGTQCVVTNSSRALLGQANYVVNAALEYQNTTSGLFRLLYNTVGPYIVAAGVDHLPDIKQQARNQLDFVWLTQFAPFGTPLTGRFAVENMLNDRFLQTQGNEITNRYNAGVKFTFGVSYMY